MAGNNLARNPSGSLDQTLDKTETVAADVQRASDNLAVIHTVLEQEVPDEAQAGDVAQAIKQTGELEKKLAESAETLAEVNAALAAEIKKQHSDAGRETQQG